MTPVIDINALGFEKDRRQIVKNISIQVYPGDILTIIGPNGAGKSTLLKLISGELSATSGSIMIHGRRLDDWSARELAKYRAVLPQQHEAPFGFNVSEIVAMSLPLIGLPYDRVLIDETLVELDIQHLASRPIHLLSGGERQRVHLARALVQLRAGAASPGVLLLDEPLSAQDISQQQKILSVVHHYAQSGHAVIMVLHDINWASHISTSIAIMQGGQIFSCGRSEDVLTKNMFSDIYNVDIIPERFALSKKPFVLPHMLKLKNTLWNQSGEKNIG